MSQEKGSSWLSTLGQIVGCIIVWFVVAGGWNGWYIWYCEKIKKEVPDGDTGDSFGNTIFFIWLLSFVIEALMLDGQGDATQLFKTVFVGNLIFVFISLIGLAHLMKSS